MFLMLLWYLSWVSPQQPCEVADTSTDDSEMGLK